MIPPTYEEAERLGAPKPSDYGQETSQNLRSSISTVTLSQPVAEPSEKETEDCECEQTESE